MQSPSNACQNAAVEYLLSQIKKTHAPFFDIHTIHVLVCRLFFGGGAFLFLSCFLAGSSLVTTRRPSFFCSFPERPAGRFVGRRDYRVAGKVSGGGGFLFFFSGRGILALTRARKEPGWNGGPIHESGFLCQRSLSCFSQKLAVFARWTKVWAFILLSNLDFLPWYCKRKRERRGRKGHQGQGGLVSERFKGKVVKEGRCM